MERFLERLDDLVFLDIKKEAIRSLAVIEGDYFPLPMLAERMIKESGDISKHDEVPFKYFIEGIFYCLGVDNNIKNKDKYIEILKNNLQSFNYIKGEIYRKISEEKILKAYFLLKGLFTVEDNLDNYDKLLKVCFEISVKNAKFIDEFKEIIATGKEKKLIISYLYEGYLFYHLKEYNNSKNALEEYVLNGGILTKEQENFKKELLNIVNFNLGKEKIFDDTSNALKLLLPLLDEFDDDPSLLYYIALGYRKLSIYEKAIFYLKEALFIDESFVDVLNELGLNYALMGLYDEAIKYFEKVYSSSKSIEAINNLLLCHYYMGHNEMVTKLIDDGNKVSKDDEIFLKTVEMIKSHSNVT